MMQQQLSEMAQRYASSLPVLTLYTGALLSGIFVVDCVASLLLSLDIGMAGWFGLAPDKVDQGQIYRLLTYPLFHGSLLHLLVNLTALLPLMRYTERSLGTLKTIFICTVIFTLLPGLLYMIFSHLLLVSSGTVLVGASGWVFAMLVWETAQHPSQSFLGYVTLPSHWYPLIVFVLVSLIPGVSFWGHFSALVIGYLFSYGYLNRVIPSSGYFERLEGKPMLESFVHQSRFQKVENDGLVGLPVHTSAQYSNITTPANPFSGPSQPVEPFSGTGQRLGSQREADEESEEDEIHIRMPGQGQPSSAT